MNDNLDYAMEWLKKAEFSGRDDLILHKNQGEATVTFYGIYQKAHPMWSGWNVVLKTLNEKCDGEYRKASTILALDLNLMKKVKSFYKKEFWDRMKLDLIEDKEIATKIFLFGVHVGVVNAIKEVQKTVGTTQDGIMGKITAGAVNEFRDFKTSFTLQQKYYYERVVASKPYTDIYLDGWINRANLI